MRRRGEFVGTSRPAPQSISPGCQQRVQPSPAPRSAPPLKGLQHAPFDQLNDRDEGERAGEDSRHIEELEIELDLKADAVAAPEQFDEQDDLPDERQPRASRDQEARHQMRNDDVAETMPGAETEDRRALILLAIERAG